jgi:kynurenine formamidase
VAPNVDAGRGLSPAHVARDSSGLEFYDLSQPFGHNAPLWPYFPDITIERFHYHSKSGVLTQRISTFMHVSTHTDAPVHVIEGAPYLDELPLSSYFGTGVVVSIPKEKWEVITPDDLERARPEIRPGDIVIINSGWHRYWGDSRKYFVESPGLYKEAGEWLAERGVKGIGVDQQALDHPLATAIGPHGPGGPIIPTVLDEYREHTDGREVTDDFPLWEPCHRAVLGNGIVGFENVGGQIDEVTGMRVTFAAFPWHWTKGDGCIVRLVGIIDPTGEYRLETGGSD